MGEFILHYKRTKRDLAQLLCTSIVQCLLSLCPARNKVKNGDVIYSFMNSITLDIATDIDMLSSA